MGWGGGMVGGPMGGGGPPGSAQPGLPFGGIPTELHEGVKRILGTEPEWHEPEITFSQIPSAKEARRLTLWRLLTEYKGLLVKSLIYVVLLSTIAQLGPAITGYAINWGMGGASIGSKTPVANDKSYAVVVWSSIAYLAVVAISAYSQRASVKVTGRLAAGVMNDLRIKIFTHLQRLSLNFFTAEKAGVVMSRMTSDIENLQQLLQDGLSQFAIQGLTMLFIIGWLFHMNVTLATYTVVLVIPVLFFMSWWFQWASDRGYGIVRDRIADVLSDLSESLHGVRIVTAHNRQRHNVVVHREIVGRYKAANMYTARVNAVYGPGTQMAGILAQALLLSIGGNMVIHGEMNVGTLVAFFLYLNRFFAPIQLLVQQYNALQQGQSSIYKLRDLLETEPEVKEAPDAVTLGPIVGSITFSHVDFGYDPATPVLFDIDLEIAPGESVAFVGPTGAGKSTMAKLVTRFYDPTAGSVRIDGYDLKDVTLHSLRRQLGVVPQEPFLFAGTIKDNLRFARPEATDAEIDEAIDRVGLRDLIDRLGDGIDTVVHERGQSLSAGERQLLALARAFLAHPRVLVLDEATSNLDLQSETKIEAALDVVLENRTAILIAHRLSTARRADRIVVIDHGRIIEMGSHDDLVALGGRYASMYDTWERQGSAEGLGTNGPNETTITS